MRILIICFALFSFKNLFAQQQPVKWTFSAQKVNDNEYDVVFKAKIDDKWCVYSQFLESNDGPVATSFTFDKNDNIEIVGKANETGGKKEVYDEVFAMKLTKFEHEAIFTQHIKVKSKGQKIKGSLTFMTCDGEVCLPPTDVPFEIGL